MEYCNIMIGLQPSPVQTVCPFETGQPSENKLPGSADGFESDNSMVKDKTELELEKLVFGDTTGFQASLDLKRPDTFFQLSTEKLSKTRYNEVGSGLEEGFEGLEDADVCTLCSFLKV